MWSSTSAATQSIKHYDISVGDDFNLEVILGRSVYVEELSLLLQNDMDRGVLYKFD